MAATSKVNLSEEGKWGVSVCRPKCKVNIVRPVEVSQQFQYKGNETVSMSIHRPVSEMHPSEITAVLNFLSAMLNGAYDT